MSVMVQVRNVPEELHRKLKVRAAREGRSLSDYLVRELREIAERPTPEELRARLSKRAPVRLPEAPAEALRAERGRR